MTRTFNGTQKQAAYLIAGGICENCESPLPPNWHADHVRPFSAGGTTTLGNLQALCPTCNLSKGAKVRPTGLSLPDWFSLRKWQEEAWDKYQNKPGKDFLAVATPGAGKTFYALYVAMQHLKFETADRIVVVCPSDYLSRQWAHDAAKLGIHLDFTFANRHGNEAKDYNGIAVTYQSVASNPDMYQLQCHRAKTFVIFDEIHHAGEGLSWGDALLKAFGNASNRLHLSGTPFRSDNYPIPFVTYDEAGRCKADFNYGYANGLSDNVCRPVYFPQYEGNMEWFYNGEILSSTFGDSLNETDSRQRLKAALSVDGDWLETVIKDANDKLTNIRKTHEGAGGLIITIDQHHAYAVAKLVEKITGTHPAVATSDDAKASDVISNFATGNEQWIVAVRMVSEGVDIKRLRVAVYATNVLTELYFRQAVGRVVRMIADLEDEQSAYFFIPKDPVLVRFAEAIKEEREHQLDEEIARILRQEDPEIGDGLECPQPALFGVIHSEAMFDSVMTDGESFSAAELRRAREIKHAASIFNIEDATVAALLRKAGIMFPTQPAQTEGAKEKTVTPLATRKQELRRKGGPLQRIINQFADVSGQEHGQINRNLNRIQKVKSINDCSEAQLIERFNLVKKWIDSWKK